MLCTFRILKYNSLHKQFVHGMKDYDVFPCKFNLIRHFRRSAINPMRERMHVGLYILQACNDILVNT